MLWESWHQALHGYVYEMIGILSATFMIGLWAGTIMTKRVRTAVKILFYLEVTTIVLAIAAPLFFREEFLFYVLILLSGVLTGSLFSTAVSAQGSAAAKPYGMDLIGSFLGSFIPFGNPHTAVWSYSSTSFRSIHQGVFCSDGIEHSKNLRKLCGER
jgi:hypothetical protein